MNIKTLFAGGILAVTASMTAAQSLDPVRVEMFRSILKGNACVLTETAAANILPRFDFTRDETRAIVGALVAAGEVRLDGNTLNLVDGSCGTDDPVADLLATPDVQQFIAIMAEHNCAMTEAEGEQVFTARGMTKARISAVVGPMIQAGMARFDSSAGVLSVEAAYCSPPTVVAEAQPLVSDVAKPTAELDRSGMFGMSRVRGLVDVMAQNGCTLNMETPDAYLASANIEHSFATFMARKMISDGFASMVDAETMLLSEPYCFSAGGAAPEVVVELPSEPMGVDMAKVDLMRQIFAANGCRLNDSQMDELLPPAGFTKSNVGPVFDFLENSGELTDSDGDIELSGDYCPSAPIETVAVTTELDRSGMFGMSRVSALVDAMAANGCTLNLTVADAYLIEADIAHSFAVFMAQKMVADGNGSMIDNDTMALNAPYCIPMGGAPEAVADNTVTVPVVPGLSSDSMQVIAIFNAVGCAIPVTSANNVFNIAEMSTDAALAGLAPFITSGEVSVNASNEFVMGPELCDPTKSLMDSQETAEAATPVEDPTPVQDPTPVEEPTPVVESTPVEAPVETVVMVENDGTPEGIVAYVAAQNGCTLEATQAVGPLAEAGLRLDQAYLVIDAMVADGRATLSSDGAVATLNDNLCVTTTTAPAPEQAIEEVTESVEVPVVPIAPEVVTSETTDDPRAALLAMLAQNNCEVTQSNVGELVGAAGLNLNISLQMLSQMMASGEATSPDGGQTLQVSAPLCVAVAAAVPSSPREIFINLIKQNNCSITAGEFSALLPVDGLDASTAFGMIGELEAEGVISLPPTRDVVTLSAEMCR